MPIGHERGVPKAVKHVAWLNFKEGVTAERLRGQMTASRSLVGRVPVVGSLECGGNCAGSPWAGYGSRNPRRELSAWSSFTPLLHKGASGVCDRSLLPGRSSSRTVNYWKSPRVKSARTASPARPEVSGASFSGALRRLLAGDPRGLCNDGVYSMTLTLGERRRNDRTPSASLHPLNAKPGGRSARAGHPAGTGPRKTPWQTVACRHLARRKREG
jgi:hypothetical protein